MARFGAKRPSRNRNPLPLIVVVCDDTKTAPAYFAEVRSYVKKGCTLKVEAAPREGATAKDVIEFAATIAERMSDPDSTTTLWAIIDLEMASNSIKLARECRQLAKKGNVNIALSQPCFEIWTLAHFIDTGEQFDSCNAVLGRVKRQWKVAFNQDFSQKKAQADYRKLIERIQTAISHASTRTDSNSQSWTEIWQILNQVIAFVNA